MEKSTFHKVGKYEIIVDCIDAVTDIYRRGTQTLFSIIIDGAEIDIFTADCKDLKKERNAILKLWKDTSKKESGKK